MLGAGGGDLGPVRVEIDIEARDRTRTGLDSAVRNAEAQLRAIERIYGRTGDAASRSIRMRHDALTGASTSVVRYRQDFQAIERAQRQHLQTLQRAQRDHTQAMNRMSQGAIRAISLLTRMRDPIQGTERAVGALASGMGAFAGGLATAVVGATALAAAFAEAARHSVTLADQFTRQRMADVRRFGPAGAAAFEADVAQRSINTGLDPLMMQREARQLAVVGRFKPEETPRMIETIASSMALGGHGPEEIQRVVNQLGAARDRRQLTERLMMSLEHAGLNPVEMIAQQMGITPRQAQAQIQGHRMQPTAALRALFRGMEQSSGGLLEQQQRQTATGQMGRIGRTFELDVQRPFGTGLSGGLAGSLDKAYQTIFGINRESKNWAETLEAAGRTLAQRLDPAIQFVARAVHGLLDPTTSFEARLRNLAGTIAGGLGRALGGLANGLVRAILGLDATTGDPWSSAAQEAATKFWEGFLAGLDFSALSGKLEQAFGDTTIGRILGFAGTGAATNYGVKSTGLKGLSEFGAGLGANPFAARSAEAAELGGGGGTPLTGRQFGDKALQSSMRAAGFSEEDIASACGPIAAAGMMRALGAAVTEPQMLQRAKAGGTWSRGTGMHGTGAFQRLLEESGASTAMLEEPQALQALAAGKAVGISTPGHYFLGQGMKDGLIDTGNTGAGIKGGQRYMSLQDIQRRGGGAASFVGAFGLRAQAAGGGDLHAAARAAAARHGVDPDVFESLIQTESGFDPRARSGAGALGLGQLMPGTAQGLGIQDPLDPGQNLDGAARYLADMHRRFGSYELALAAYNAGPGAVAKYGGIPPFEETRRHVSQTMGRVKRHARGGLITEPVVGVGTRTGTPMVFGEAGAERVGPAAAATGAWSFTFSPTVVLTPGAGANRQAAEQFARWSADALMSEMAQRVNKVGSNMVPAR